MKKLMIAASAAFMATVGFGLESANVVGYVDKALQSGFVMLTPCFTDIGESKEIDLTALSIKGYDEVSADEVNIQILNAYGQTATTYYWFDLPDEGLEAGWYDGDTEPIEPGTVKFASGDGLWISGQDGYAITFPGQVNFDSNNVPLCAGFVPTGNMTAKDLDLTLITVSGYDEVSADEVNIQVLNAYGQTATTYYWFDLPDEGLEAGWYDGDTEPIELGAVTFAPGTGMWVSGQDGYFLNFPETK